MLPGIPRMCFIRIVGTSNTVKHVKKYVRNKILVLNTRTCGKYSYIILVHDTRTCNIILVHKYM